MQPYECVHMCVYVRTFRTKNSQQNDHLKIRKSQCGHGNIDFVAQQLILLIAQLRPVIINHQDIYDARANFVSSI